MSALGRLLVLGAALLLAAGVWSGRGDGRTHLIVPPLPGDVALVRTGDGYTILLDGGADAAATANWLGHELPFYRRRLDLVILTRADPQTLPGQLGVLRRYSAGEIAYVAPLHSSPTFDGWHAAAARSGHLGLLRAGARLRLGTTGVEVLLVQDGHAALRLEVAGRTIDIFESLTEADFARLSLQPGAHADLLLLGWKVRPPSSLAQEVQRGAVIYMSGGQTAVGQSVAERWPATMSLSQLYHPALHGRIDWSTDGRDSRIDVERRP